MATPDLPLANELAGLAARMAPMLLADETANQGAAVLTSLAVEAISGAIGAGITLIDPSGRRTSTAATGDTVGRADVLQYELGEGPCLDAYASRSAVEVTDLTSEQRWPRWVAAASALGLRSSVSTPLLTGERALGAVKVYSDRPRAFDDRSVRLLQGFADTAALVLGNVSTPSNADGLSEPLRQALQARDVVQLAKGVLMQRDGLTEDAAFQVLVGQARAGNRVLREVAEDTLREAGASTRSGAGRG